MFFFPKKITFTAESIQKWIENIQNYPFIIKCRQCPQLFAISCNMCRRINEHLPVLFFFASFLRLNEKAHREAHLTISVQLSKQFRVARRSPNFCYRSKIIGWERRRGWIFNHFWPLRIKEPVFVQLNFAKNRNHKIS